MLQRQRWAQVNASAKSHKHSKQTCTTMLLGVMTSASPVAEIFISAAMALRGTAWECPQCLLEGASPLFKERTGALWYFGGPITLVSDLIFF